MIFIGLTLMGYFSYRFLSMELYPNAELPMLNVQITATQELDPSYIETKAAAPMEGVISTIEGVEKLETRISTRMASITVTFTKDTDIKYAFLKLDEKIKTASTTLPEKFRVTVNKTSTGMVSSQFMTVFVLSNEDVDYVRNITDKDIAPALENVDGVAGVMVIGGRQKSIEIIVDKEKCEALGINRSQISSLIASNMENKTFVGQVFDNNQRYFVNITAEYLKTDDIGNIVVGEGPLLLKDIADINFGVKEEESYSRVDGKEVVTCVIARSPQENIIRLSERVRAEIDKLNTELASKDVKIDVDTDMAETMSSNLNKIVDLAISGALLAIFILYLFLRNFRIVCIIAFAIPISVFSAFYLFYLSGISINTLTLTGIALAIGMLLDNSIVVMENIFRLRSAGMSSKDASVKGTKEVWKSIFASTLTTITVFLPFLFSDNFLLKLIGEHVGISIISTLGVSLIVALMLIPMAVNYFMSRHDKETVNLSTLSPYSRPVQAYLAILKTALRKPAQVVLGSLLLFLILLALTLTLSLNTLRDVEADTFQVYTTSPAGYTLERTDEMIRRYEEELMKMEEIERITSKVYATEANVTVKLKEDFEKINRKDLSSLKNTVIGTARYLRIYDVSLEARSTSENFQGGGDNGLLGGGGELLRMMGLGSQTEKVVIKGQDFKSMENLAEYIQYQLRELSNIRNANVSSSRGTPEARIMFDQYLMGINDVTPMNVLTELNNFAPENVTNMQYKAGDEEYDIIIKDKQVVEIGDEEDKEAVRTLDELRNLEVANTNRSMVGLQNFSGINLTRGKGSITRINQEKEIEVRYSFNSEINESKQFLTDARREVDDLIQSLDVPAGLAVEVVHEEDTYGDFSFLFLAALIIIYMILASVFESMSAPIVLMFAIPLAGIGSLLALMFTGTSLMNTNVLIGFLILIGIVVNNSIILIDYTSILRRRGYRKVRALITAGMSRLRPILITAITTIVAMIPLALGKGEYVSGLGAPFAITVIGGLAMSTLLTLVVIPTLYSGLEDALKRLRTQSITLKIIQFLLMITTATLIFVYIDALWWRIACLILAVILVPAVTWFVDGSLRRASSGIIPEDEEIEIRIENLVKIYGRPSEFAREWISGKRIRERLGIKDEYKRPQDLLVLLWLLPLTIGFYYFGYFYQTIAFWAIVGVVSAWLCTIKVLTIFMNFAQWHRKTFWLKTIYVIWFAIYYILPFMTIVWAMMKFLSGMAVILGLLWYLGILVKHLSDKIHKRNINIDLIDGDFRMLRKAFYRFATKVPLIGYRKQPFKALNAVSMEIRTGMFGLLGPNGAGKTTLMRIICGVFEQSYGKIFVNGIDTQKKREELQGLIGYLPQEFGTYENLTSWEFLEYQALLKGITNKETRHARIKEVLEAVHLYENKDKKIGGFSGGMKQRIGIAQTLLNLPRILVVDEPTAGLDPRERIRFRNLLVELSRSRIVIFSTHIIEDISSSCNQVAVIDKGSVKYFGTPYEMVNIAKDVIWVFEVSPQEFEELSSQLLIVHHIRIGDVIRVRCLSEQKPLPQAQRANPLLEDSYLWLLRSVKLENNEEIIT
jgi:multidrug efflux pump subunit AcrB/ABC-type multidrug transport system ATPase subunit